MRNNKKSILVLGIITVFIAAVCLFQGVIFAGDLEPTDPPGSSMHTLEDIYNKIDSITCEKAIVVKTGQTATYATRDDGDLEKGMAWPDPRFTDNGDGTVTDNLTGLIWLKNANCFGDKTWADALSSCNSLADGSCDLTDGSVAGDWRLPNIKELQSLIDFGKYAPALPSGHPFTGVVTWYYWSGTTHAINVGAVWYLNMNSGFASADDKGAAYPVWPVRGGN